MRKQLVALRNQMKTHGIDLYILPTTDYHGSEYVNDYFKCQEYISGFTGSAGTLIVKQDFAGLWTDGRYFIQAVQQLHRTGVTLMKMGQDDVPTVEEYLQSQQENTVIGFDGRVIIEEMGRNLEKKFQVVYDVDLAGEIWEERPKLTPSAIYALPFWVTGDTVAAKLQRLRSGMGEADYILLSSLEEIAWLYNLRGADIDHTPVFYSFALISRVQDTLYVMDENYLIRGKARHYDKLYEDLKSLRNCTVMLDQRTVSYALSKCFDDSVKRIVEKSPAALLKAIKNETEIAAEKNAHIKDGAAMVEFIYWLKNTIGKESITERSAADYLEQCRRNHGAYDISFQTIAGYEAHGAIVHYAVTEETDVELKPEGFLLVDSGGQYHDGTTDITRTIALGEISAERKRHYTAVLKGHIALALCEFAEGTTGAELDAAARKPLQDLGLDYNHGTGHGVGHMLSVHEGPNIISPRGTESRILPGMITSNEPGVYLEGKYGIRIENELLCIEQAGRCAFETITLCPYERDAIDSSMLTETEVAYINNYHQKVYETLEELLEEDVRLWLKEAFRFC